MGHYASEMGEFPKVNPSIPTGYANQEILDEFFGGEAPTGSNTCPRCGAMISWNWNNVTTLLLHINWHKNLKAMLRGVSYPGIEI